MRLGGSAEIWIFAACLFLFGVFLPPLLITIATPLWVLVLLECMLVSIAFQLSEIIAALFLSKRDLPRLTHLDRRPSVALLYLICDDLVQEALTHLGRQSHEETTVFVLDDSREPAEELAGGSYTIVRRAGRSGHKAGSINNWLRLHGANHDYFVILDSDSILPDDFVQMALLYAEHPENGRVAIFNTLSLSWNTAAPFARSDD